MSAWDLVNFADGSNIRILYQNQNLIMRLAGVDHYLTLGHPEEVVGLVGSNLPPAQQAQLTQMDMYWHNVLGPAGTPLAARQTVLIRSSNRV